MKQMSKGQRHDLHERMDSIFDGMKIPTDAYQAFPRSGRTIEFDDRFRALIREFFLNSTNPFANEKVTPDPRWNYSTDTLPTVHEQVSNLHNKLGLMSVFEAKMVEYPTDERADGVIIIPLLRDLGIAFNIPNPTGDGYGKLGESVWEKVSVAHNNQTDKHHKVGSSSSNYIQLNADVRILLEALETRVPTEKGVVHYHALPVSTGNLFAGYSPRNTRLTTLQGNMLPLGFVQVLCIMLGWPGRLSKYQMRWINCPADEYKWQPYDPSIYCPLVQFHDHRLKLDATPVNLAHLTYGSAVAFPGVSGDSNLGNLI